MEKPVETRPVVRHDTKRKEELPKLRKAHLEFTKLMKAKMEKKAGEGFRGWDVRRKATYDQLKRDLVEHFERADKDPEQFIDVAIYALFCWTQCLEEERRDRVLGIGMW
jgi:hypothetical protein